MDSTYDSNITSIYQTPYTLKEQCKETPEKKISINLAKIDLIIDEIPYPHEQLISKYNEIDLLISQSFQLVKSDTSLACELLGFLNCKLNKIINVLIIDSFLIDFQYNAKHLFDTALLPDNGLIVQFNGLLEMLYKLSNPLSYKLNIDDIITIELIKIFKGLETKFKEYLNTMSTRNYIIVDTFKISKVKRLTSTNEENYCNSIAKYDKRFKGLQPKNDQSHDINTKYFLINKSSSIILSNCHVSIPLVELFNNELFDSKISLSIYLQDLNLLLNNYINQSNNAIEMKLILQSIIIKILKDSNFEESNEHFRQIILTYNKLYNENFKFNNEDPPSSKKTVIKITENHPINFESNNYKFYLGKQVKEPEWVKNFYDTNSQQENIAVNEDCESRHTEDNSEEPIVPSTSNDCDSIQYTKPKSSLKSKFKNLFPHSLVSHPKLNCRKCRFLPWHSKFHKF